MISHEDAMVAVGRFNTLLYFDKVNATGRAEIADILIKLVNDPVRRFTPRGEFDGEVFGGEPIPYVEPVDRLEWLVTTLVSHVGTWPGPQEMRAIYCCRFPPADGEVAYSQLPGFTAPEMESGVGSPCLTKPIPRAALAGPETALARRRS